MSSTATVRSLAAHLEWADALIWRAALKLSDARQDRRLVELLHHLHSVQRVYLQVWRGEPLHVPDLATFPDLSALATWTRPFYPELRAFAQTVDDSLLSRNVTFPWAAEVVKRLGSAGPATLGESVLQVVLHSGYHRGQVATRLRELGGDPPLTDFIAWIWMNRPEPEWNNR